jgi:vacuolar-type H+-ATPase subunit I/STV1
VCPAAIVGQSIDLLLLVAGVLGALAFMLWKVILPAAKMITVVNEEVIPNVKYMKLLAQLAPVLAVLNEIATQFREDSGSTLKDTTNRLEQHAEESKKAAEENRQAAVEFARVNRESITALQIEMGTVRELAKEDRRLARGDRDLARDALEKILALVASAQRQEASGLLAEASRARTEASGARIEAADAVVAEDLAAQQQRADDVESHEPPGSAADAASQSPEDADEER